MGMYVEGMCQRETDGFVVQDLLNCTFANLLDPQY